MTTYLTWFPDDLLAADVTSSGLPAKTSVLSAFNARCPKDAAGAASLRAPTPRYPWSIDVSVVRAEDLGRPGLAIRTYHVEFTRGIKSVEVAK